MLVQLDLTLNDVMKIKNGLLKEAIRLRSIEKRQKKDGTVQWLIDHTRKEEVRHMELYNNFATAASQIIAAEH